MSTDASDLLVSADHEAARLELLEMEKAHMRAGDELARRRRDHLNHDRGRTASILTAG